MIVAPVERTRVAYAARAIRRLGVTRLLPWTEWSEELREALYDARMASVPLEDLAAILTLEWWPAYCSRERVRMVIAQDSRAVQRRRVVIGSRP